ncbi:alpha/beta hydrolase [Aspergillus fumigatus]|nr:alpha/beta hydrolase [Aspergillus fumigatus]
MLAKWALRRVQRSLPGFSPIGTVRPSYHPLGSRSLYSTRNTSRRRPQLAPAQSRGVFTSAIPPVLIPPVIFVSLLLGLWTWKCFWIVVMQDKLLYISWLPPFARSEQISDYAGESRPVHWEERRIRSLDGTKLAVCEGRMPAPARSVAQNPRAQAQAHEPARKKLVVICYFQGNGGSTPMRLPLLSQFLRAIHSPTGDVDYLVVALSYRGYWKSSGRASQIGIELDAVAFLQWVAETYGSSPDADVRMVLWGHSLGTAIASSAAATYLTRQPTTRGPPAVPIAGMILEAPMSSTKDMLISLYPQKWLPYRYLWPFLWNNWSSAVALERMARWRDQDRDPREHEHAVPPILLLSAEKDEVIPVYAAAELEQEGKKLGLNVDRLDVSGAMHTEIPIKAAGRQAMIDFIKRCTAS